MLINNAVITGSFVVNGTDVTYITGSSEISASFLALSASYLATSASYATLSSSYADSSASLSTRVTTLESASGSFAAQSASLSTRVTDLESTSSLVSSSFASTSGSIAGRVNIIETSYATTGSNTFTSRQYINDVSDAISFTSTASLYTDGGARVGKQLFVSGNAYFNNVTIYGTSSIEYITSSQLAIGTNIITLNTDTPAIRYGGISVFDSGSNNQSTGSLFWDSEKDKWIYSNPSGSTYDGGMLISGPRNSSGLGNEQGTTLNAIMRGQGGDHITSSLITDDGSTLSVPYALTVTGSIVGSSSNRLGSSLTDVQQFTGSLRVTGSGNNYFLGGNVGIGTSSPTRLVDISGSAGVLRVQNGGSVGAPSIELGVQNQGSGLFAPAANTVAITTNDTERLRITSGGNLQVTGSAFFSSTITAGGALSGTSATFSGNGIFGNTSVSALNERLNVTGNGIAIEATDAGSTMLIGNFGGADGILGTFTNDNLQIRTNNVARLTIANSGAATFSSDVSIVNATAAIMTLQGASGNSKNIYFKSTGNADISVRLYQPGSTNNFVIATGDGTVAPTDRLTISSTGAATFSSSVTATGGLISNGGSIGYGGGELGFNVTTSGATSGIYTTATGSPILYFDHRATGNTGFWVWRSGTGGGTTALTLSNTGAATFSNNVTTNGTYFVQNTDYNTGTATGTNFRILLNASSGNTYTRLQTYTDGGSTYGNIALNPLGGNVGIGTNSPAALLDIQGTAESLYLLRVPGASPHVRLRSANGTVSALTTSANGNRVGQVSFEPYVSSGAFLEMTGIFGVVNGTVTSTAAPTDLVFAAGSSGTIASNERMRITSGGKAELLIGTQTATWSASNRGLLELNGASSGTALLGLKINDSQRAYFYHNNTNLYIEQMVNPGSIYVISFSNGVYLTAGATSWTANSDERLKNITGNIENAVESLSNLRTVKHTWKSDDTKKEHLALIAQDVEKVFPQVIDKNKLPSKANEEQTDNTEYLGVRYTELVPVLVKAIQELKAENDTLKLRIENLESK